MNLETLKLEISKLQVATKNLRDDYKNDHDRAEHPKALESSLRFEGWIEALKVVLAWVNEGERKWVNH